ncbi:MAG: hypothetical protein LQ341_007270 [Variospora aurantia]|nr:MAG: hypothetical protein LQ341_007270 [Variospora aurantia]
MPSDTAAEKFDNALKYRQNAPIGTGASVTASTSSTPAATSSTPSSADETSSSDDSSVFEPPTVDVQTTSELANDSPFPPASTNALPSNSQAGDQETTLPAQSPPPADVQSTINRPLGPISTDASRPTRAESRSVSSRTQQFITTVVAVSGSSTHINVYTTDRLLPASTSSATSTIKPSLDTSDGDSGKSGLDQGQKRIVIGVVIGIGGAFLIGGIVIVAWRIWGRKGHSIVDGHELMDSHPGSSVHEKRSSFSGQSPFRTTLDQYHNRGGPVNTASNF